MRTGLRVARASLRNSDRARLPPPVDAELIGSVETLTDRWQRLKVYISRLRRDTIFILELLVMVLGLTYLTIFMISEVSNSPDIIAVAFGIVLFLVCVVAVVMYRFNGSPKILRETIIRTKTIIIFGLLAVFLGSSVVKPLYGARTISNSLAYCLMVALLVLTDVLIDRHRSVYIAVITVFVGTSLYNISVWSFTGEDKDTILVESLGQKVLKRTVLRTIQVSLLIQLLEGMLRLIRTRSRRLPGIYVFTTKGCYRPKVPVPPPRNPRTIFWLTRALAVNEAFSIAWYILFALAFYNSDDHYWLAALICVHLAIMLCLFTALLWNNVLLKSVKRLLKEPNVWLLLVLTGILGWSNFRRPLNRILNPLLGTHFVCHFVLYLLMDTSIVVDRVGRMLVGLLGCIVCGLTLFSIAFLKSGKIETFLIQSGDFELSKRELWRVVFFNMLFFLVGAVVHDIRDKQMKRFLFVRRPKPRENVLFSELLTRSTRISRVSATNPDRVIHRASPGHTELARRNEDALRDSIVVV